MTIKPSVVLGEVLFDIFPGGRCLGGAPFNFAFHLHSLGVPVVFASRVGRDELGNSILDFARRHDFPVNGIQLDGEHATGEVKVSLDSRGSPKFEILPDRAYDYMEHNDFLKGLDSPPLVYFGTLAQRNAASRRTIREVLKSFSGRSILFLDLNLRPPFYTRGIIESSLEFCDVLKVSGEELDELRRILELPDDHSPQAVAGHLQQTYQIGRVCVTRGEAGSEWYRVGASAPIVQPAHSPKSVQDTVGAGDAFSAMLAFGLLRNHPEPLALERASLFASEICTIKGALPQEKTFYTSFGAEDG